MNEFSSIAFNLFPENVVFRNHFKSCKNYIKKKYIYNI